MDRHIDKLRLLLSDYSYNYEILSFFAEQIKSEPEKANNRVENLISLVNLDSDGESDSGNMSMTAKVMQILYYMDKKIPKAEWNGKNLSGINVPGADFSEQNFSGTKFLKANLNNVILDACDCSYCDMSGVRLGETNKVAVLKFEGGMLLSLYKDGSIRQWDLSCLEEITCTVIRTSFNDAVFGNGTDLFVQDNNAIELLGKQKDKMVTYLRYLKNHDYRLLFAYEGRILIKEDRIAGDCISLINMDDFKTEHKWQVAKNSKGIIVNNQLALIYDGNMSIELYSVLQQQSRGKIDISKRGPISSLAAYENNGKTMVAFGYDSGEIRVYQCDNHKSEFVATGRGIGYGLSHLVFCGASTLAAANSYGEICLLQIDYHKNFISMDASKVLKLGIYCKGIKTEGLVPEEIRIRLESRA